MRPVFNLNARVVVLATLTMMGASSYRVLAQSSPAGQPDTANAFGTQAVTPASHGVTWFLQNVTFSDGSKANGHFTYDESSGTYSDVDIMVTRAADSYFPASTPLFSYPKPAPQSYVTVRTQQTSTVLSATNYVSTTNIAAQPMDVLALVFSQPLTNAGGTVSLVVDPNAQFKTTCTYDVSCSPPPSGISQESASTPTSAGPAHAYRIVTAGSVRSQVQTKFTNSPAVWRPTQGSTQGLWYTFSAKYANGAPFVQEWGVSGDFPVPGDYDGDGKTDLAIWRPDVTGGVWYIVPSSNPGHPYAQGWGEQNDVPLVGDYDGDGKTDLAIWRPSTGVFYIIPSSNPSAPYAVGWGVQGDVPITGDFDGDGKTDIAIWRPNGGYWYVIPSSNPSAPYATSWGISGDVPVIGDFDGDGKTDLAVWRPTTGVWYIVPSSNPSAQYAQGWGVPGDFPVAADYDGDGKTDIAIWRPSASAGAAYWYIIPSSHPSAQYVQQWGAPGDQPLTRSPGN